MPRGQAREYVALDLADLEAAEVVKDPNAIKQLAPAKRGFQAAERSDLMKKLDGWSNELYDAWVAGGKPNVRGHDNWAAASTPVMKLPATADKVESMKFLITASAKFTGHTAVFGSGEAKTKDGRIVISYRVVDPRPRSANGSTTPEN